MTDVFFADALVFEETGPDRDPLVTFVGERRIRLETDRADVRISEEGFGPFPAITDLGTGLDVIVFETQALRIGFDLPAGGRGTSVYLNFYSESDDEDLDVLVRVSGPELPEPAPGQAVEPWLTGIGATVAISDDDDSPDPPFQLLEGRYADGRTVAFQDIAGLELDGGGLTIGEAALVALLYDAGLDRNGAVDLPGLNFWIDSREGGASEAAVAREFLRSPEFRENFGNALDPAAGDYLANGALVRQLYRNVLDREGETAGIDYWTGLLDDSAISRARLLVAFADSAENRAASSLDDTISETTEGDWIV